MISSRLNYCNSLLFSIPDTYIQRLQCIRNHSACVVARIKKFNHITPIVKSVYWLSVKARILFRSIRLTYKSLNGMAPEYISEILQPYIPTYACSLRSGDKLLLTIRLFHMVIVHLLWLQWNGMTFLSVSDNPRQWIHLRRILNLPFYIDI